MNVSAERIHGGPPLRIHGYPSRSPSIIRHAGRIIAGAALAGVGLGIAADLAGVRAPEPARQLVGGVAGVFNRGAERFQLIIDRAYLQNTQSIREEREKVRAAGIKSRAVGSNIQTEPDSKEPAVKP